MAQSKDNSNKRSLKKLYNLHAWVGFQLAIVMFVILFTGTIATISNEIDWLIFEEMRASPEHAANDRVKEKVAAKEWTEMFASLKAQYPDSSVVSLWSMGEDYLTYRAFLIDESLPKNRFVQVDQWTYEVTGVVPRLTVQRFFRDLHRYLFMPSFPGIIFVCAFAFVLLISVYTGIKTTKNWRKVLWRLRFSQGARIALSDLHKFAGLWGLWFTLIISITGVWYLYEFGSAIAGARVEPAATKLSRVAERPVSIDWNVEHFSKAVANAQNAHENWEITRIFLPSKANSLVQFRGISNNPLLRDRAYRVFLHPESLDIVDVWTPESIGVNAYLNEYIDPLHFGNFGGIWSKLIWFMFGIALTAMSVTGVAMTWKRVKSKAITRSQIATLPLLVFACVAFFFWVQRFT